MPVAVTSGRAERRMSAGADKSPSLAVHFGSKLAGRDSLGGGPQSLR